jgi:hypothetical protein
MFIQTETTPNPATLKFLPGRAVLEGGTMEFTSRDSAARSPLATKLFDIPGVTGVFYGSDFVTVTKDGSDCDPRHHHGALHVRRADPRRRRAAG